MHKTQTLNRNRDGARLWSQFQAVKTAMGNNQWWTIDQLETELMHKYGIRATPTGISARIRDLRKEKFGGYRVDNRNVSGGLWEYRLVEQASTVQ